MKTWKTTGLALAACLAFVTTACQAEVKDDAASKSPDVTINGNNGQNATAIGGASNKVDRKDPEQNVGSNNRPSNSKGSKGGSSANVTSTGGAPAEGGAAIDDDDWKEAAADKNAAVVTAVGGNAVISNSGGTVHVKGSVDQIIVTGSDVKATAKTAKKISIQGSSVRVFVEQVPSVDFNGSGNRAEWANGSEPAVNDNGSDNGAEKVS